MQRVSVEDARRLGLSTYRTANDSDLGTGCRKKPLNSGTGSEPRISVPDRLSAVNLL